MWTQSAFSSLQMLALPQSRKAASFTSRPRKLLLRSKRLMTKWLVRYRRFKGSWPNCKAFFGRLFRSKRNWTPAQGKPAAKAKPVAKKKEKPTLTKQRSWLMWSSNSRSSSSSKSSLAAHIREEEEKSQTVYDPNANLMEAALNRVMAQDQMAALEVTIRETMVYKAHPKWVRCTAKCLTCETSYRRNRKS
jgi:hypothetical protein